MKIIRRTLETYGSHGAFASILWSDGMLTIANIYGSNQQGLYNLAASLALLSG